MNTATTNPPIRIRRITAPAIEASEDPRPSLTGDVAAQACFTG